MNHKLDDMIRTALQAEKAGPNLSPERQERIWMMTEHKIKQNESSRRRSWRVRPMGVLIAVIAVLTLLCTTVFASTQLGLFDLSFLFGEKAGLVAEHVAVYPAEEGKTVDAVIGRPGPLVMHHEEAEGTAELPENRGQSRPHMLETPDAPSVPQRPYRFADAAETQDYRFALRSLTAGPSAIYAVLEMTPRTEFGRAHMGELPELVCSNRTAHNGGETDCILLEGTAEVNRILVYCMCSDWAENKVGDAIGFEILSFYEGGDPEEHNAFLFDAKLESIVTARLSADHPEGTSTGSVNWTGLRLTPMALEFTGSGTYDAVPSITVSLRDGSQAALTDPSGGRTAFGEYGAVSVSAGGYWGEAEDAVHLRVLLSQLLDPAEVAAITIDGQCFRITDP